MTRAKVGAIVTLLICLVPFSHAQQSGQNSDQSTQESNKPQAMPRQPEVSPPQGQPEAKPPKQTPEAKPPKNDEQKMPRSQPREQPKPNEHQKPTNEQSGTSNQDKSRPVGKSAHIPDPQFKANFGRPHLFTVNRVITTTTIIPNQTQFVFAGFTFVFLDPWPADWLFTDECYIDFVDEQYFLFDVFHPGVRVALFVVR